MSEIQTVKPQPQIGQIRSSALSPAAAEAANLKQVKVPTAAEVVFGNVNMLGDEEVNPDLIAKAKQGDEDAQRQISELIDIYSLQGQQPQIAGTRVDVTGKRVPDIPKDAPEPIQEELKEFGEGGTRLLSLLKSYGVSDPLAQQTIIDTFLRGEFFVDTKRGVVEGLRFMSEAPNLAAYLAMSGVALAESLSSGKTFNEAYSQYEAGVAKFSQMYEKHFQDNVGMQKTFGSSLNKYIVDKYKKTYDTDEKSVYNNKYVFKPEIEGVGEEFPEIESRIISDELGQELLDFSFKEMPFIPQVASFLVQNLSVSAPLGILRTARGDKKLKFLDDYLENPKNKDSIAQAMDVAPAFRFVRNVEATTAFRKKFTALQQRIGDRLNLQGSILTSAETRKSRQALKSSKADIQESTVKYQEALAAGDSTEINIAKATLDAAQGRYNRLLFKGAKNPFFRELVVDETVIALGQALGYNYLPQLFNGAISEDTGGVIAALSAAFVGRPAIDKAIKYGIPYGVGGVGAVATLGAINPTNVKLLGDEMVRTIEDVTSIIPLVPDMRGMFIRRDFDGIEAKLGRPLTAEQAASLRAITDVMEDLRPSQREQIYEGMIEFEGVRQRLLNVVSPEKREEANQLLTLSFAGISSTAPLQAIELDSIGKVRGTKFVEALDAQEAREASIRQSNFLLNEFRKLVRTEGINTEDSKFAFEFIQNAKKAEEALIIENANSKRDLLGMVRAYRNSILENPLEDIDADFLPDMIQLELRLGSTMAPGAVRDISAQREKVSEIVAEIREGLNIRYQALRDMRGTGISRRRLAKMVEETYDIHVDALRTKGKQAYTKLEEALGDEKIDFSGTVRAFLNSASEAKDVPLRLFFNSSSEIFTSRTGRQAFKAFETMAEKNLLDTMSPESLSELTEYLGQRTLRNGKINKDYIEGEIGVLDVALFLTERKGSTFNPFQGGVFELDEVYRHFRNVGNRIKKTDDKRAAPYLKMMNDIDMAISSNPNVGSQLQDVRSEYQDIVFDIKRPGSLGDKIDNSATGPDFVSPALVEDAKGKVTTDFARPYKKGQTPGEWHKEIVLDIGNAINGKTFSEDDVIQAVQDLKRFWSNSKNGGLFQFDTTTKEGKEQFDNLRNMLEANLYEYWGAARSAALKKQFTNVGISGVKSSTPDYDFSIIENLENIKPYLEVDVIETIDGARTVTKKPILNLDLIYEQETDISKLIARNAKLQLETDRYLTRINDTLADVDDDIRVRADLRRRDEKDIGALAAISSPVEFFRRYVSADDTGASVDEFSRIKAIFVDNLVNAGVKRSEAIERFNEGAKYMLFNGLLKNAGEGPNAKQTFFSLEGGKKSITTLSNPSRLIADIENPNIRKIMEEIDVSENDMIMLEDMGSFMQKAYGVERFSYIPKGKTTAISVNEIISRSFNLARGMVSPQYVAAELAFRIMSQTGIDSLKLAATNREAGDIMLKILQNPEEITDRDIRTIGTIATRFIIQELYYDGNRIGIPQVKNLAIDIFSSDEIESAQQRKKNGNETVQ